MKYSDLFDSGARYQPRKSVVDAANITTGIDAGALSASVPKPNVVRIEVLPSSLRQEYLGSFYSLFDKVRQSVTENSIGRDAYLPFYGIMDSGGDPSFSVSAKWEQVTKGGFSGAVQMLKDVSDTVGKVAKQVNLGFASTAAAAGAKKVSKLAGIAGDVTGLGSNLLKSAGVISEGIGTSTLKSYNGGDIGMSYTIGVKWYLPEQEIPCMVGVNRLIRMTYLRAFKGGGADQLRKLILDLGKFAKNTNISMVNDAGKGIEKIADNNVAKTVAAYIDDFSSDVFGTRFAIAPLPVRLSIGHTLDVQPMVITNVSFTTSQEQFISTICGAHLPVSVSAKIDLAPWMKPGPDREWFSFLGHEVFGSVDAPVNESEG